MRRVPRFPRAQWRRKSCCDRAEESRGPFSRLRLDTNELQVDLATNQASEAKCASTEQQQATGFGTANENAVQAPIRCIVPECERDRIAAGARVAWQHSGELRVAERVGVEQVGPHINAIPVNGEVVRAARRQLLEPERDEVDRHTRGSNVLGKIPVAAFRSQKGAVISTPRIDSGGDARETGVA